MSKDLTNSASVAQIDKRPCFSIPARPLSVDVGILDLEPDTEILISTSLAGLSGRTVCKAKDAIEEIKRTIKRQAKGHYIMVEAAEIIAEAYGFDASDFLKTRMQPAFESGALKLLDPKDGGLVMARQCKKHYDWVVPANLDKWLETEFECRWPLTVASECASSGVEPRKAGPIVTAQAQGNSTKAPRKDSIDPVIELAKTKCRDPKDTNQVWPQMQVLADNEIAPFLASTPTGLKYRKSGKDAYFTRNALDKRLHPEKRKSTAALR